MKQEEIDKKKKELYSSFKCDTRTKMEIGFEDGVVFTQSKMYSEEDMINAFKTGKGEGLDSAMGLIHLDEKQWFKSIKKWNIYKLKIFNMNFGTPQEMLDDYRENNPKDNGMGSFIYLVVCIILIVLFIKYTK